MDTVMICQHFNEKELCDIYDTRPKCCRTFPNLNSKFCIDNHRCIYKDGKLDCVNCKDKCCRHIYTKDNQTVISALDIDCEECTQIWCE